MKKDIIDLFCFVDDFAQAMQKGVESYMLSQSQSPQNPTRTPELSDSEIMTIVLIFQDSPCRNFKYFYNSYLQLYRQDFPKMPSYERFVTLMPRILSLAVVLLHTLFSPGKKLGYIDATSLAVCHPKRIKRNKVFKGLAALGKTTKGWFFGFKLHVIVDEKGNILRVKLTPGNVDDRAVVESMTQGMTGLLFGDKGYIDKKLFLSLYKRGLKLVTGIRKNMKNILTPWN